MSAIGRRCTKLWWPSSRGSARAEAKHSKYWCLLTYFKIDLKDFINKICQMSLFPIDIQTPPNFQITRWIWKSNQKCWWWEFIFDTYVVCVFSTLFWKLTFFCCVFSVYDKRENPLLPEEEEQRAIAKIKMLGNIKFIGELGKLDLIHESILHKCIKTVSMGIRFRSVTGYIFIWGKVPL